MYVSPHADQMRLHSSRPATTTTRKELRTAFTTFREKQFEHARDIVKQLYKWREERIANNQTLIQKKAKVAKAAHHDAQIFSSSEFSIDSINPYQSSALPDVDGLLHSFQVRKVQPEADLDLNRRVFFLPSLLSELPLDYWMEAMLIALILTLTTWIQTMIQMTMIWWTGPLRAKKLSTAIGFVANVKDTWKLTRTHP